MLSCTDEEVPPEAETYSGNKFNLKSCPLESEGAIRFAKELNSLITESGRCLVKLSSV